MSASGHNQADADPWVARFARHIAEGGAVLDVACGGGRHSVLFARLRYAVTAVDRDLSRFDERLGDSGIETIEADLEQDRWPFEGRRFAGIVVVNYLHRPLLQQLLAALDEGGVLIYRTFQKGNEAYGRPSNPDFLLNDGELLAACRGLRIVAYEAGYVEVPKPAVVQQICAIRPPGVPAPRR